MTQEPQPLTPEELARVRHQLTSGLAAFDVDGNMGYDFDHVDEFARDAIATIDAQAQEIERLTKVGKSMTNRTLAAEAQVDRSREALERIVKREHPFGVPDERRPNCTGCIAAAALEGNPEHG